MTDSTTPAEPPSAAGASAARIERVEVVGRRIPFETEFPVRYSTDGRTEHAFVRVVTADGQVGYGEGTALPWFTGETTDTMTSTVETEVVPEVEGLAPSAAAARVDELGRCLPDQPGAMAGVDMALLDLRAKRLGAPAHALLGPKQRSSIPIAYTVSTADLDLAERRLQTAVDRGFRQFKFKAKGDIAADSYRINRLLSALPSDAAVRIDPNASWEDLDTARRALEALDRVDRIEYLEQPVGGPEEMRRLRTQTGLSVFADESAHDAADVLRLNTNNAADGVCVRFAKSGRIATTAAIARVGNEIGMDVTVSSALGTSLDAAANLHLAATVPSIAASEIGSSQYLVEDPTTTQLGRSPEMAVPTEPGLGVALDDDLFE